MYAIMATHEEHEPSPVVEEDWSAPQIWRKRKDADKEARSLRKSFGGVMGWTYTVVKVRVR